MNARARQLEGLGVVITRPRPSADALAADLEREGARTYIYPTLAIAGIGPSQALEAALAELPHCDLAIFVSANAVEQGLACARSRGPWPERTRVAGVGDATAAALRNSGFEDVISPRERQDSEGLLALEEFKSVAGSRVLIFRGEGGREHLRTVLEARGARVTYAECYRRVRPTTDPAPLLQAWSRGELHAVSVLSGETLENFITMIGAEGAQHLPTTALVVPHQAVARHPDARRFGRVLVAPTGREGLIHTLAAVRAGS